MVIIIKQIYFKDFTSLACDIADKYDSIKRLDEYEEVAVVAKYEEARQIIKELMCIGYDLHSITMHDVEYDNYNFEYIISLYDDEIFVEPMVKDNGYLTDDSPVMYVLDNCSSKVIPFCKGKVIFEVSVGEYDCEECQCTCTDKDTNDSESTYISRDKDGNPLGFNKVWSTMKDGVHCYSSYSHYSSDVNLLRSIASDFGIRL